MNRPLFSHRLTVMLTAFFTLAFTASIARAQSVAQLESEISSVSGQMSSAESNASTADQVITRLDSAEGTFAKLTSGGKVDKGSLIPAYRQLESMLDRMQTAWSKKKDDCISADRQRRAMRLRPARAVSFARCLSSCMAEIHCCNHAV